jgi:hypothetical protein
MVSGTLGHAGIRSGRCLGPQTGANMASANQGGSPSPTSPRRISAAQRQARALDLRKCGYTLAQIAEELGYASDAGVRKALRTALERTVQQPADEVRLLIQARNDELLQALYPRALDGELEAVDRVLKINRETAAIHGLIATKVKVGQDPEADPVGVRMTLEVAVYEALRRLPPEQRKALYDLRERLVGAGGGGADAPADGVGEPPPEG